MQPELAHPDIDQLAGDAHSAVTQTGWPSSKYEAWKFTPLDKSGFDSLAPASRPADTLSTAQIHSLTFKDGYLVSAGTMDKAISLRQLGRDDVTLLNWLKLLPKDHHLSYLSLGGLGEAVLLEVEASENEIPPLTLHFTGEQASASAHPVVLVQMADGARLTLIEEHVGSNALSAPVLMADVGASASLHVAKYQDQARSTSHLGLSVLKLGEQAKVNGFTLSKGSKLARMESHVEFMADDAELVLSAIYLGASGQHHDITTVVQHEVPNCQSNQVIRGVLNDDAHGVFQGKVRVAPDAQKTDGQQMSRALLLSRDAVADAKPELEIFADDVVCAHGATVGELDETLLFYLKSRGIPKAQAQAMLIKAFLGDALEQIDDDAIASFMNQIIDDWAEQNNDALAMGNS